MKLRCVLCAQIHPPNEPRYRCDCGATLDVVHDLDALQGVDLLGLWESRRGSPARLDRSGVWRYRELIAPGLEEHVVTRGEGNTWLYDSTTLAERVGLDRLLLKHEGENPTASFKDRGMTVAITVARWLGMESVACASTGNTSASMAAYAALTGMPSLVFVPAGNIAYGKLSQALAYGGRTLQLAGDFDDAMALVQQACTERDIYLVNSVNPFRIEGQKAIGFELLSDLGWQVPDWIVLPGGNLGNNTAIAKGLIELHELGLIERLPRIAVIQAAGANPLYTAWTTGSEVVPVKADTRATAIKIGAPVSWRKSLRGLSACDGVVTQVDDQQILDAKAWVDAAGIGAEPASCATVAGVKRLVDEGVIRRGEMVTGVLTGHVLKDPEIVVRYHLSELEGIESHHANAPIEVAATLEAVLAALGLG
ncbi:MAG TPA: threonine synthase [Myxococcota bacterium]|nr:threonine synthase [Myxococcota bacterium]